MYFHWYKKKNDENCVAANMYTVFWFNKQNGFDISRSSPQMFTARRDTFPGDSNHDDTQDHTLGRVRKIWAVWFIL